MLATTSTPTIAEAAVPVFSARPQSRLGDWQLVSRESEGPLSIVYRARPAGSPTDRPASYAVKLLADRWNDDPRAVALFHREAHLGQTVRHPHLISVLAAGLAAPPYYLVMPWLEGQTVRQILDRGASFEVPAALWIARQAAEALDALASAGWRHGDLKPENLLVSPEGHVTLLDLGLARRADETDSALDRCVAGTLHYLAPESITSTLASDIRGDLYSLGAVLFEMLVGRPPFEALAVEELLRRHRETPAPDPRRLAPRVPDGVARLIRQLLSKQPLRRPQTPAELIDRLARLEVESFGQRSAAE